MIHQPKFKSQGRIKNQERENNHFFEREYKIYRK